jgi:hypothetical protein
MVVMLESTRSFLQKSHKQLKLTGTGYFDRDEAQILAVDLFVDGWRDLGPCHGTRSTGARCTSYKG